jgi:hypothetical protein
MDTPAHPRAGRPALQEVAPGSARNSVHRPMNATAGYGSWSLAGRMSHDGRHGVARHHAPQQPRLLRTGHRPILEAIEAKTQRPHGQVE